MKINDLWNIIVLILFLVNLIYDKILNIIFWNRGSGRNVFNNEIREIYAKNKFWIFFNIRIRDVFIVV